MAEIDIKKQIENYTKLNKRLAQYSTEIQRIFEMLNVEGCQLALSTTPILKHLDKAFRFADYPQTKAGVEKLLKKYTKELQTLIISGMEAEYTKGDETQTILGENIVNRCNSALPEDKQIPLDKAKLGIVTSSTDLAVKSFTEKRLKNFNLRSVLALQSVKYKDELECAISTALTKGTSARELAKQVTTLFRDHAKFEAQYLEKFGEKLNTGKTMYEAMRLARTEINMAYRDAEQSRWGYMPFILGYEIRLSNNHNCKGIPKGKFYDICDELEGKYPKDFKWLGWHPNCYHKNTKILTNNGWKYFYDVLDTDLICSLNPETKKTEWVHFVARQKYWYKGDMVHFYNKSLECLVTPEHSMVYLDAKGNICRREASEFTYNDGGFILGLYTKCSTNYFSKEIVPYNDFVYDLTLEKNHIFYVSLNGKCFWGSNCRCHAIPILMSDEQFIQWNNGKQVNAPTIDKMPEKFDKWLEQNKERIERATQRGILPYFLRDNGTIKGGKFVFSLPIKDKPLTILEKAEIRHKNRTSAQIKDIQTRWDNRNKKNALISKTADNILKVAKIYPEVDTTQLKQLLSTKQYIKLDKVNRSVAKDILNAKKDDKFLSKLIPDVREWKKQFTSSELHNVYNAVEKKMSEINNTSLLTYKYNSILEQKKALIEKEIHYVSDPNYLKPHKLYSTWNVSQAAYTQQLTKVIDEIEWENITKELKGIVSFKTKSKPYHNLVNTLQEAIENKNKVLAEKTLVSIQSKRSELEKATLARLRKKIGSIKTSNLSDMNQDEIDRILDIFKTETMNEADKRLRSVTEKAWTTLTDEEKLIITKYTQTYCYLNEPLRGLPYYGSLTPNAAHVHDLPILTSALEKFEMPHNTVIRRGVDNYPIKELGYNLSDVKIGDVFVDKGFLSTSVHSQKGFFKDYNLVICVPKGAKGFYAEPFSHYTDFNKFDYHSKNLWDGKSVESIGSEAEWIGQRGSQFKVLKKQGNTIYLQLIGQLQ